VTAELAPVPEPEPEPDPVLDPVPVLEPEPDDPELADATRDGLVYRLRALPPPQISLAFPAPGMLQFELAVMTGAVLEQ
jgi:hypothetical protein